MFIRQAEIILLNLIHYNSHRSSSVNASMYIYLMVTAEIISVIKSTVLANHFDQEVLEFYSLIITSYIYFKSSVNLDCNEDMVKKSAVVYDYDGTKLITPLRGIALLLKIKPTVALAT